MNNSINQNCRLPESGRCGLEGFTACRFDGLSCNYKSNSFTQMPVGHIVIHPPHLLSAFLYDVGSQEGQSVQSMV
jgi:hypothetical protein